MGRVVDHHRRVASTCILVLGLTSTQLDYTWLGPTSGFPIHGSSLAGLGLNAKSNVAISSQELVPLISARVTLLCFKRAKGDEGLKFKAGNLM